MRLLKVKLTAGANRRVLVEGVLDLFYSPLDKHRHDHVDVVLRVRGPEYSRT